MNVRHHVAVGIAQRKDVPVLTEEERVEMEMNKRKFSHQIKKVIPAEQSNDVEGVEIAALKAKLEAEGKIYDPEKAKRKKRDGCVCALS